MGSCCNYFSISKDVSHEANDSKQKSHKLCLFTGDGMLFAWLQLVWWLPEAAGVLVGSLEQAGQLV